MSQEITKSTEGSNAPTTLNNVVTNKHSTTLNNMTITAVKTELMPSIAALVAPSPSMKVDIPSAALAMLKRVMPRRPKHPVLACVKIERISDYSVLITATNSQHWMSVLVKGDTAGSPEDVLCVPFALLKAGSNTITTESVENNGLNVKYTWGPSQGYPTRDDPEGTTTYDVTPTQLLGLKHVSQAQTTDGSKQILQCIYFDGGQAAATDRHRLHWCALDLGAQGPEGAYHIQPNVLKSLKFLNSLRFGPRSVELIGRGFCNDKIGFDYHYTAPKHDGQFPVYRQLIPTHFAHNLDLDIKAITAFAKNKIYRNILTFEAKNDSEIHISGGQNGSFDGAYQIDYRGGTNLNKAVCFNSKYLIEGAGRMDAIALINAPTNPAVIHLPAIAAHSLVMPTQRRN